MRHVVIDGDAAEFFALEALQGDRSQLPPDPDPQSVAFLQISGGSTGLSKLIPRTHDDYIYSFRASNDLCGINRDSVYLVALPAAHNFPMSSPGFFGALYLRRPRGAQSRPRSGCGLPVDRPREGDLLWAGAAPGAAVGTGRRQQQA